MARTITRYRFSNGVVVKEEIEFHPNDRPSDWERVMLEAPMAERVLRGYKDIESSEGSDLYRKLPAHADTIKRAWAEPGISG